MALLFEGKVPQFWKFPPTFRNPAVTGLLTPDPDSK
jgi:hypothetical protein